jgi:hypothetical protein
MVDRDAPRKARDGAVFVRRDLVARPIRKHDYKRLEWALTQSLQQLGDDDRGRIRIRHDGMMNAPPAMASGVSPEIGDKGPRFCTVTTQSRLMRRRKTERNSLIHELRVLASDLRLSRSADFASTRVWAATSMRNTTPMLPLQFRSNRSTPGKTLGCRRKSFASEFGQREGNPA